MLVGKVKWFNNPKGYGFIQPSEDTQGKDVLVHYSVINMDGFRTLKAGQQVRFEVSHGPKGLIATLVIPIMATDDDEHESNDSVDEKRNKNLDAESAYCM